MLVALTYLLAMACSNEAIQYVSYPTQALAKSCKMIPVMLARVLYLGKRYSKVQYACVLAMVAGVAAFQLARVRIKDASPEAETHMEDHTKAMMYTAYGYVLLFASLAFDGFTGPKQENLRGRFEFTPLQLMAVQNLWATALAAVAALIQGQVGDAISYLMQHPALVYDVVIFALTSGLGQIFIFWTVVRFDSLILSTVTTTRKFFTILVSVVLHGHPLVPMQWAAVALVFGGIIVDQVHKYSSPKPAADKDDLPSSSASDPQPEETILASGDDMPESGGPVTRRQTARRKQA